MLDRTKPLADENRGQSELVGYALVFAALITALGLASVLGVSALEEVQSSAVMDSGELAMQSVGANVEALTLGGARARDSELRLQSGTVSVGEEMRFRVEWRTNPSDPWEPEPDLPASDRTLRPIVFSTDEAALVYSGSLLIRDQREGAVALTDPLLSVSSDRALISVPLTTPGNDVRSINGGTHTISTRRTNRIGTSERASAVDVRLTIRTVRDRAEVWQRVLNEEIPGSTPCGTPASLTGSPATVTCHFTTERLTVSRTYIAYRFR